MNIENLQRIATLFHVSAEPPAVEVDSSGVWEVSASSAPPFSPFAAGLVLSISALGATPAEALAAGGEIRRRRDLLAGGAVTDGEGTLRDRRDRQRVQADRRNIDDLLGLGGEHEHVKLGLRRRIGDHVRDAVPVDGDRVIDEAGGRGQLRDLGRTLERGRRFRLRDRRRRRSQQHRTRDQSTHPSSMPRLPKDRKGLR